MNLLLVTNDLPPRSAGNPAVLPQPRAPAATRPGGRLRAGLVRAAEFDADQPFRGAPPGPDDAARARRPALDGGAGQEVRPDVICFGAAFPLGLLAKWLTRATDPLRRLHPRGRGRRRPGAAGAPAAGQGGRRPALGHGREPLVGGPGAEGGARPLPGRAAPAGVAADAYHLAVDGSRCASALWARVGAGLRLHLPAGPAQGPGPARPGLAGGGGPGAGGAAAAGRRRAVRAAAAPAGRGQPGGRPHPPGRRGRLGDLPAHQASRRRVRHAVPHPLAGAGPGGPRGAFPRRPRPACRWWPGARAAPPRRWSRGRRGRIVDGRRPGPVGAAVAGLLADPARARAMGRPAGASSRPSSPGRRSSPPGGAAGHRRRSDDEDLGARAPLRISFAGGGTDVPLLPADPRRAVLSTPSTAAPPPSLPRRDGDYHVVSRDLRAWAAFALDELAFNGHLDLVKAVLRDLAARRPGRGLDFTLATDAPPGSGLGSSSALVVAMLAAVGAATGRRWSRPSWPAPPTRSSGSTSRSRAACRTSTPPPTAGSTSSSSARRRGRGPPPGGGRRGPGGPGALGLVLAWSGDSRTDDGILRPPGRRGAVRLRAEPGQPWGAQGAGRGGEMRDALLAGDLATFAEGLRQG